MQILISVVFNYTVPVRLSYYFFLIPANSFYGIPVASQTFRLYIFMATFYNRCCCYILCSTRVRRNESIIALMQPGSKKNRTWLFAMSLLLYKYLACAINLTKVSSLAVHSF